MKQDRVHVLLPIADPGDKDFDVGRAPIVTAELPRTRRAGIRTDLP